MKYINKKPEFRKAIQAAENVAYHPPSWANTVFTQRLDLPATAQKAIDVYLSNVQPNGLVCGVGWWQNANGYTAIALKDRWLGDKLNTSSLASFLRLSALSNPYNVGFVNVFNDDCCWWALCCLYVYALEGDAWFLTQAETVWRHVKKSMLGPGEAFFHGQDMDGAVFWTSRAGEESINSISTGLFAELSVRLALVKDSTTQNQGNPSAEEYLDTCRLALGWIFRCRYNAEKGVVYDNIKLNHQVADDRTFTYNAGVALGTAALLYECTHDEELLTLACHMAYMSMTRAQWVDSNGVLTERDVFGKGTHDPLKNRDGVGFKAVLIRQLGTLYDVIIRTKCTSPRAKSTAAMIHTFFYINLHAQLNENTDGQGRYGPWWNGPFEFPTNHSQMAVLDVMAAAMLANYG